MINKKNEEIIEFTRKLHLVKLRSKLDDYLEKAQRENPSHADFLHMILREEVERKESAAIERRIREAYFPYRKYLEDFDLSFNDTLEQHQLDRISSLDWLDKVFNLILLGPPGVGKTHLSIGIGIKAATKGYTVSYVSMKELVQLLKTEEINIKNRNRLNRIRKSQLLLIDEVGYLPISPVEAGLFFHLLSELHEKTSILITSNKGFDQWPEFFGDPDVVLAALDRILYHCDIIQLDGKSYRLEHRESLLN